MAKKKTQPVEQQASEKAGVQRLLAPASKSIESYYKARKKLDEEMDERLVEEVVNIFTQTLNSNRLHGKGQWWDPERCSYTQLVQLAQRASEQSHHVDAAILHMMAHAVNESLREEQ